MKKLIALLLALCMLLLVGCQSNQQNSGNAVSNDSLIGQNDQSVVSGEAVNNGYVRDQIALAFTGATSLTPWGTTNATPGNYSVYESLFAVTATGEVFPILADKSRSEFGGYDHVPGSGVYTVYIYDYIHDHNGNHVDANDVVFSYTHQYENETTSGWGDFVSAKAIDETTIEFTFTEDQSNLGEFTQFFCRCFIVDEDTWEASPSHLINEMIGTGPYKQQMYISGSSLSLVAYDDYWQTNAELRPQSQQANVKKIVYKFIDEASTRIISLKAGDVDISDGITSVNAVDFLDGAEYGEQFNVYTYMTKEIGSLWLNCSPESICGDVNMRKAIYYAIDLDGLIALNGGTDVRGYTWATGYYSDYHAEWETMENYNTFAGTYEERAELVQKYLDAAGYNGEPIVYVYQNDQSDVATIVINMLANYGINVTAHGTDHAGASSIEADPTAWDMEGGKWAGDYNAQAWLHAYDWANTADGDHTTNYIYDQQWQDLLMELQTQDGHTTENLTKWLEIMYENAYGMNLYCQTKNVVYPSDMIYLYRNDKLHILPGACVYQPEA